MPRKPAHEQPDTLDEIREAAFSLFGRYGFDGVSIGDIAGATKLSKGALYWHFKGKDELYIECLRYLHRLFFEYLFTPMQERKDPIARVITIFQGLGLMLGDARISDGIAGYWMQSTRSVPGPIREVVTDFEDRVSALLIETLEMGIADGQLKHIDNAEKMARALVALIEGVILPLRSHSPEEIRELLSVMASIYLRAHAANPEVVKLADSL